MWPLAGSKKQSCVNFGSLSSSAGKFLETDHHQRHTHTLQRFRDAWISPHENTYINETKISNHCCIFGDGWQSARSRDSSKRFYSSPKRDNDDTDIVVAPEKATETNSMVVGTTDKTVKISRASTKAYDSNFMKVVWIFLRIIFSCRRMWFLAHWHGI